MRQSTPGPTLSLCSLKRRDPTRSPDSEIGHRRLEADGRQPTRPREDINHLDIYRPYASEWGARARSGGTVARSGQRIQPA
jgi:hypothetical protein